MPTVSTLRIDDDADNTFRTIRRMDAQRSGGAA